MPRQYTHEEYVSKLKSKKPHLRCTQKYKGSFVELKHRCMKQGHGVFTATPNNLLAKGNCPKCGYANRGREMWTDAHFRKLCQGTSATPLEPYKGNAIKIAFECKTHHQVWRTRPAYVLRGHGCPSCKLERIACGVFAFKAHRGFEVQGYEPWALDWMLAKGYTKEEIQAGKGSRVPRFSYVYQKHDHVYLPDAYIAKERRVVEVKSVRTLGLNCRMTFGRNRAKAKAVKAEGYKFNLLLFSETGRRLKTPKEWWNLTTSQMRNETLRLNGGKLR